MSDDGPMTICGGCQEQVDPDGPGIVRAVELLHSPDDSGEVLEGMGVFSSTRLTSPAVPAGVLTTPLPDQSPSVICGSTTSRFAWT
jgi:hypothetical protein